MPLGFGFAGLFLWMARPTWALLAMSLVPVVPGLWLRAYASGYVKKNMELTTTGPYGYTRNPLYLGSMLIAFGFAGASGSVVLLILLTMLFAGIYGPTIRSEEAFLRVHFGNFDEYCEVVPRLLPRLTAAPPMGGGGAFSIDLWREHREYNSLMGAGAIYMALVIRLLWRPWPLF